MKKKYNSLSILSVALGGQGFEIPKRAKGKTHNQQHQENIAAARIEPKPTANYPKLDNTRIHEFKTQYPPDVAASFTKKQAKKLIAEYSKRERKALRRYVTRCRRIVGHKSGPQFIKTGTEPKRQRKLRLTYNEYIHSKVWADRKAKYYQTHPRRCAVCWSVQKLHLHHMVYHAYDGTEPDEHLVPLCNTHHDQYHRENGTQGNMLRKTRHFIEHERWKHLQDVYRSPTVLDAA